MADTDETKNAGASVQAQTVKAAPASSSQKSALRRKMVGRGQTSLSSRSPMVLPNDSQPLLNIATSDAPMAELAELADLAPLEAPALDVSAVNAIETESTPSALLAESAKVEPVSTKRAGGRPRKSTVPASSFTQAVAAVEPASIKPAKVKQKSADLATDHAPAEQSEVPLPAMAADDSPTEQVAEPVEATTAPQASKPITTPTPIASPVSSIKDKTMDMSANFNGFQGAMSEAQAKAQAAFEKSSSMLNEAGDFAKGNVEAMIESSKIFAEGVQNMGSSMVSEGRTAFETMTGDIKELAAVKSPTDFFKLQSELVRKSFDSAVAQSSKNTETLLKLMSDAFAPVSGRVSLAVEKARQVAPMNSMPASMTVNA